MLIQNKPNQTIYWNTEKNCISVIDQRLLPHKFLVVDLFSSQQTAAAIKDMVVRGAPLIGVTAAYGFYLAMLEADQDNFRQKLSDAYKLLVSTRPTAVNLKWALDEMMKNVADENNIETIRKKSFQLAEKTKADDVEMCRMIGVHGVSLIEAIRTARNFAMTDKKPVNILTHCNAGWLACVDWGTATSPMYHAQKKGIDIHVWVDETRPRNQGASLTAFELGEQKIPHTLITDNAGGHLMQNGKVEMVIVGADRVAANGDVANKIGTYLKALAAKDNNIPFYVAFPSSTFDNTIKSGTEIEIEERDENEVKYITGKHKGEIVSVLISPENTSAANFGFDVTPAKLITGYITEKGVFPATEDGIKKMLSQ